MVIEQRRLSRIFNIPGPWALCPREDVPPGLQGVLSERHIDTVVVRRCGQATEYRWLS